MYHYIRRYDGDYPYFNFLHVDDFQRQLDFFASTDRFIGIEELNQIIAGDPVPEDGITLTFDDGFRDHSKEAFPILKNRGICGIFYVPTGPFNTGLLLDVHKLHLLTGKFSGKEVLQRLYELVDETMLTNGCIAEYRTIPYSKQMDSDAKIETKKIINYFISQTHRSPIIDSLIAHFDLSNEAADIDNFYLKKNEIRSMQEQGMMIGSHTVTHGVMRNQSLGQQKIELEESFDFLEKVTNGLHFRTFCYPHGGFHTFTRETEGLLNDLSVKFSFNVEARDINEQDVRNRPQALPRYNCNYFPNGTIFKQ